MYVTDSFYSCVVTASISFFGSIMVISDCYPGMAIIDSVCPLRDILEYENSTGPSAIRDDLRLVPSVPDVVTEENCGSIARETLGGERRKETL